MTRKFGHAQVCKLPGSTCRTTDFLSYVTNQTRPLPSVFGPFVKKNVGKVELIGCLPRGTHKTARDIKVFKITSSENYPIKHISGK